MSGNTHTAKKDAAIPDVLTGKKAVFPEGCELCFLD